MSLITISEANRQDFPLDPYNDLIPPAHAAQIGEIKDNSDLIKRRYFSITLDDINMYHKDKLKKWIKVYEKVLGNCFRRIREHVLHDQSFCFFEIPEFIPGFPVLNMTHCTCFMLRKLRQAKFTAQYFPPNILYIAWQLEQPNMAIAPPSQSYEYLRLPPAQKTSVRDETRGHHNDVRQPVVEDRNMKYITVGPVQGNHNNSSHHHHTQNIAEDVNQSGGQEPSLHNRSSRANAFAQQEEDKFLYV